MAIAGFALFIFGVGVILVIVAPIGKRKNNRCSAQTQGTLREIRGRYNSDGSLHGMRVYAYFVDGIEYQLKSTAVNRMYTTSETAVLSGMIRKTQRWRWSTITAPISSSISYSLSASC